MYQNHYIAKSLTNTPLGELIRVLKYKCEWKNKKLIQIDRYYASSQICSKCGYKNEKVKDLGIRKWECSKCNTMHDRDYNASENILFEGIKLYMKELLIKKNNKYVLEYIGFDKLFVFTYKLQCLNK